MLRLLNNTQLRESPGIKEKSSLFESEPQNDLQAAVMKHSKSNVSGQAILTTLYEVTRLSKDAREILDISK